MKKAFELDGYWFDEVLVKLLHKGVPIAVAYPAKAPALASNEDSARWFREAAAVLHDLANEFELVAASGTGKAN